MQRGQILRKLPHISARNLQKVRKHAEACGSMRKHAEACGSPAEALRKHAEAYGNPTENPVETPWKPKGKILRKLKGKPMSTILRKSMEICGSMRKPAEALRKPCGSPAEALRKSYGNFSKIKIDNSCGNPTEIMRKLPHASACFRRRINKKCGR